MIAKQTLKYAYNITTREPQVESLECLYLRCYFPAFPIMAESAAAAAAATNKYPC